MPVKKQNKACKTSAVRAAEAPELSGLIQEAERLGGNLKRIPDLGGGVGGGGVICLSWLVRLYVLIYVHNLAGKHVKFPQFYHGAPEICKKVLRQHESSRVCRCCCERFGRFDVADL